MRIARFARALSVLTFLALAFGFVPAASAVTTQLELLLDLDNDTTTGCNVSTVEGPFAGADQKVVTTVDTTGPASAVVTRVEGFACNQTLNTFPSANTTFLDTTGWPIGFGLGDNGLNVVETYFPLSAAGGQQIAVAHLGVTSSNANGGADALLTTDGTQDGLPPIVWQILGVIDVPTLSEWGVLLLAFALAGLALVRLRRRAAVVLGVCLALGMAGALWALCVMDGNPGEWSMSDRRAHDEAATNDGDDIASLYAMVDGGRLCFRIDASLVFTQAPMITSPATVSVPENQTSVIDVQSTDPDGDTEGAGLTYSLTGGADLAKFSIVPATGVLTFNSAPNFESPTDAGVNNVYDVQVTVTDSSSQTGMQNLQVTVTNVNEAPSITSSATVSVPENQTAVIDVQSTDPDGETEGAGLSYSLTGGADLAKFSIVPATGVLTFNIAPDFESPGDAGANNVYDVQVTVTDAGTLTDVQNLQVTVTNTSEPPTITSPATVSVPENQTSVIDVQSTDPDGDTEGAGLTYSLTGGADLAKFSIVPATGVLTFNSAPNFESPTDVGANNVYDVQVTVTDSGTQTGVQNLQVTVTNVNEAPSITSSATVSVPENQTSVIDVQSTDPDGETEGAGLTYSLTGGADLAKFSIVPATGVLTFNIAPDFESPGDAGANNVYDVQVTVTDAGTLTGVQNLQVTVTNLNEGPSITSSATISVPENQTSVIDVQSTDPDGDTEGAGLTYSLTGGVDLAKFSIVPATGVLTFNIAPNFESPTDAGTNNVYDVQVTVTDSGSQTGVQNLQVTVTNLNESPSITSSATVSVPENQTAVIDVQSTDPDGETEGAGLSYSLTGGADLAKFSIVPATGVLTFNIAPNFESPTDAGANNVYDVQVTVTDAGTLTGVQNLQVTVTNVNEPPSITSSAAVSVPENQTAVIDVQSTDPDGETEGAGLSYSLTGGADLAKFSIVPATGVLTFNIAPNFESPTDVGANNVYDVQVTVTDAGTLTGVQNLQVTVTNLNEAPSIITSATVSVPENQTSVIDVQSTDPDGETEGAGLSYSLTGGADLAKFSIIPATGVLTFNIAPNFESPTDAGANNVYDVQVTVTDAGTLTGVQNLQVTVTNLNEAPSITSSATVSVPENQTSVINVQSTDPDGETEGAGLSYSLTGGADLAKFSIVPATGVLTFNIAPNFESPTDAGANNVYDVQVTVTDAGTLTGVQNLQVTVTNLNEAPSITTSATVSVPENQTSVIDVQSIDPDGETEGAGLSYSLTGGADLAKFSIVPATGVLTFNIAPNFEIPTDAGANNVYDVQVTVTDAGTLTGVQNLQVTVTDVPEPPLANVDFFDTVGNTELRVDRPAGSTPNVPYTTAALPPNKGVLDNDSDSDTGQTNTLTVDAITSPACGDITPPFVCTTTNGGTVTMEGDGSFSYVPPAGNNTNDTFTYRARDVNSLTATAQVTIKMHERAWYVRNNEVAGGLGRSTDPFDTLAEAQTNSLANDYIFVYLGDSTSAGQTGGIVLKSGQHLIGEHHGLSIQFSPAIIFNGTPGTTSVTLHTGTPGNRPLIDNAGGNAVSATDVLPVEIVGLSLLGSVNAIDLTNGVALPASATLAIQDNIVRGAGAEGFDINLNAGTTGTLTLNITGNGWDIAGTHTGNAVDINRAAGTLNLNFSGNTNILSANAVGAAVNINGGAIAGTTITGFSGNTVHGNTAGAGIIVSNATFDQTPGVPFQTVSGGTTSVGSVGNGVGTAGMALSTVAGDLSFSDLLIVANGGAGLQASSSTPYTGSAGFQITVANGAPTKTVTATGGPAVSLTTVSANLPSQVPSAAQMTVTSTNSLTTGVLLDTVLGTFSADNSSSITNSTGTDFNVNAGSVNVTYAGTITDDIGQLVSIANTTGGTKSFTGAITDGDDGDGSGISINNNSNSPISFTGGLTLSTGGNPAFTATTNNTGALASLVVSGTNKITTTTGTALNVTNTTIGGLGLTFRSISSNGAANGIVLNNTGSSGGLAVTGDSGGSNNGSGGSIQNTTAEGILLNSTNNVSLGYMNITNSGTDSIRITNINGFTLNRSNIDDAAGTAPADKAIDVGDFTTGTAVNGTINITNNVIGPAAGNSPHDSLAVGIGSGTSTWNVTNTTFRRTGNSGIDLELRGTAVVNAFNVNTCTFAGAGFATSARGVFANNLDDSVMTLLTIQNSIFTNNNIHIDINQQNDTDPVGSSEFAILNNTTMTGARSHAINVFSAAGSFGGGFEGTISGNVIGNSGVVDSGSAIGNGIRVNINGGASSAMLLSNNTIRQTPNGRGIEIIGRNGTGGLDITVTNNDVNPQATASPLAAILVQSNCLTVCNTVRSDVRGNTVPSATDVTDLLTTYLELVESGASTLDLVDTTAPISGTCASELAATNTGSTGVLGGCALIAGPIVTP